jgi:hypothetical protein
MNIKQTPTEKTVIITNTVLQGEFPLDAVGYIDAYVSSGHGVDAIVIIDQKIAAVPLSCIRIIED